LFNRSSSMISIKMRIAPCSEKGNLNKITTMTLVMTNCVITRKTTHIKFPLKFTQKKKPDKIKPNV